jgi:phosphate-selective porin OprO/OprP
MRTNVQTGNAIGPALATGPEFLEWNNNVRESGWRAFWDLHMAYFYRHLSLLGEWQSGFQDYALASTPANRIHVPVGGFYVQSGYFLTGETVTSRGPIRPIRDFDIRKGK